MSTLGGTASIMIGKRKTGKTTLSKELLDLRPRKMPVVIYDVNNEYFDYYPEPFIDFDVFLQKLPDLRHTYILIEEATIFFDTSDRSQEMKNVLVRARHTGNIIQLNFHSFLSTPKNIYNLLDFVTVFKTNDSIMTVEAKFDNLEIIAAYKEAMASKDPYFRKTVSLV